jgi:hypothetical protein
MKLHFDQDMFFLPLSPNMDEIKSLKLSPD